MRRRRGHAITGAFAFMLLGVFALAATMLALFGAQTYRSVVAQSQSRSEQRTLAAMVRNAVRTSDAQGALSVESLDGVQAICFSVAAGDEEYVRYLYVYEGMLRELFISAQREFEPAAGSALCAAQSMHAQLQADGALSVELTDAQGGAHEVLLALRAGNG